ncbi:MAG: lysophospholipid acyltransferase family protein [Pyrinomonadaceae bacterium]
MTESPTIEISASARLAGELAFGIRENKKIVFPSEQNNKSRLVGKLWYWWAWLAAGSMLLVVGLPGVLFLYIINRRLWLYPLALWGAKYWLKACGTRVNVTGLENLEDGKNYVFASNHRSYLDTAALFRYAGRRIGLVAKKELLAVPVMGQGMGFVNIIAIDRSNPERARKSMEKAQQVMRDGYSFGVFVEGTRAMPGELLPFKKGAFHLALQTGADIIPVAFKNTDRLMGKETGVLHSGSIDMVLMPPISTEGRELMEILLETREAIATEMASMPTGSVSVPAH